MKKVLIFTLIGLLAVTGLFAAGNQSNKGQGAAGKKLRFAVFIANNTNEFTMSVGKGAENRGKELGIDVTVFDAKYDQALQISQMETCITQGYDALIVEPCSIDGLDLIAKEAKASSKIPIITVIQEIGDQSLVDSFVGLDLRSAARIQMQACMDTLGGKGNIGILDGTMGSSGQIILSEGFNEVLRNYPNVKIIEEQDAGYVVDQAIRIVETWLQKHNNFDAILGQSDAMAVGAAKACEDAGITGIYISGRDATTDALNAIKAGKMASTIWQDGPGIGRTAVDVALKLINGESVQKLYMTENVVVDKKNVDTYLAIRASMAN
jgi:ribose transport system substrate-binding protein/inositol transport system substrate-binding protein